VEHPKVNMSLQDTIKVLCEECQNNVFQEGLVIRKVSSILTGTGKPGFIPIPVFACNKCGHVNQEFLPQEVKNLDD